MRVPGFLRLNHPTPAAPAAPQVFALPLVSIIITAYNYGRFLEAAVASVLAQSYADVECIIVNDGSEDDTAVILARLQAAHPQLKIISMPQNRGQGVASRVGLQASSGQYIVFMDADDVLARDYALTHVYVHLSARLHAGFSSSDILQTQEERIVATTGEALNQFMRAHPPVGPDMFRPLEELPDGWWPYTGPGAHVLHSVRHVPAGRAAWSWSPMTGNMFRREILLLLADCDAIERLRVGTDVYLCTGVNLLCGSFLIDQPLSAYRIHGANHGSTQVQLDNMRTVRLEAELSRHAKELLLAHFIGQRGVLNGRFWNEEPLGRAIDVLRSELGSEGTGNVAAA